MKCPKCHSDNPPDSSFCGKCGIPIARNEPKSPQFGILSPDLSTETLQSPVQELTTGSTFANRYQIIEELGKGGMGRVYKAFDQEIQAKIALKLIKPEISASAHSIERFRNELKIARDISHKNICRMYDLGKEAGSYFITMEYVSGEDIKSFIRRSRQLVVGTAVFIAKQICEGLAEAHRLGVVHRDLKPGNIMINSEGNAKIVDFGIARSISVKGVTESGAIIGTPAYMSPEQVDGREVDRRSDIYSLGIILYEMLTGQVPFDGDTPFTICIKQKSEIPKDPRELNAQIPQDLSRLILKCLEKDKEMRYQSADELRADLEKIEKGMPNTERPIPKRKTDTSKPITVTFSRKKLFVSLSLFILLLIAGFFLWRMLPSKKAAPMSSGKPSLAILYFRNSTGDKSFDVWRDGLSRMLISDLSQSKYIRVVADDQIYSILDKLNALEKDGFSTEDLREIVNRAGVTHLLRGIITKSGDSFRIQATLQEANRLEEIAGAYSVNGVGEGSFFGMIDELTRKIKTGLNLSGRQILGEVDKSIGEITTNSPEAYKLCNEGYRLNYKGEYRKAIEPLEQAVKIDPKFAFAYFVLGMAYGNLGYSSKCAENGRKAFELSDRLPERERLWVLSGYYQGNERTLDKAIEAYNQRLQLDPDDLNASRTLASLYGNLENWDRVLGLVETNIRKRDEAAGPYSWAAIAYRAKGLYDKAQAVLEEYVTNIGDLAIIHRSMSTNYLCQGKYDLALREADKAFSLAPSDFRIVVLKGNIRYLMGDFSETEKETRKLLDSGEKIAHLIGIERSMNLYQSQGRFEKAKDQARRGIELSRELDDLSSEANRYLELGYIYIVSGNPAAAIAESQKARKISEKLESISRQMDILHIKGLALLEMKSISEAKEAADEIKTLVEGWLNPKLIRIYYHLMGMIELKQEKFPAAIGHFEKAISLLGFEHYGDDHAFYFAPLAYAYFKSGDLEKAREQYEKITRLTTGRLDYGDIYAKSFYMLGKIAEQKGEKAKARVYYQRFLDLWKDADPGQREVEDARLHLNKSD